MGTGNLSGSETQSIHGRKSERREFSSAGPGSSPGRRLVTRGATQLASSNGGPLFQQFDTAHVTESIGTHYQTALNLISSPRAKQAFNIKAEPEALRERYGRPPWARVVFWLDD